jgi:hypothetical protein
VDLRRSEDLNNRTNLLNSNDTTLLLPTSVLTNPSDLNLCPIEPLEVSDFVL